MADLKIAIVGAGSFVFGPSMLQQVIFENQLQGVELALIDIDAEGVELMAEVGRRMASEAHLPIQISAHTSHEKGLNGADFVICSVARQGFKRYEMDCDIISRYIPGHEITEFGGIEGISSSLRQIAMIVDLSAEMKRYCPQAWLFDIANPLPRVCQAAHEQGVKTAGFCSVAQTAYSMAWQILYGGEELRYPFTAAREHWNILTAGLNHFTWLLRFEEKDTHADLMPRLRQALSEGHTSGNPVSEAMARETGYLLVPVDNHTRDFLPPTVSIAQIPPFHGTSSERQHRITRLQNIARGNESYGDLFDHPSWERPIDVIAALIYDQPTTIHSLNLHNDGQIANLSRSIFVETPCSVTKEGINPQTLTLPSSVIPITERTALVTDTIVQAALQQNTALVHYAIELDPTILDKAAGKRAIDACIEAHADMLPCYQ